MKKHVNSDKQENYMVYGMCFGALAGAVGMSICSMFGQIAFGGFCISGGLLIGMVIGLCIEKKR